MASNISVAEWPSARITIAFLPIRAAGKLASAMTMRSLCPISQRTFSSSGEMILGIFLSTFIGGEFLSKLFGGGLVILGLKEIICLKKGKKDDIIKKE